MRSDGLPRHRTLREQEVRFAGHKVKLTPDVQLFRTFDGFQFGVEICEDVWAPAPPSNKLALAGADVIFNLSATDEVDRQEQLSEEFVVSAECPYHHGLCVQFLRLW